MFRFSRFLSLACMVGLILSAEASAQNNNCIPPSGHAAPVGTIDSLRGAWMIIAYATAGPAKGRITSGTLDLSPASADARKNGTVMVGSATLDLAKVGGRFAGSLRSRDPGAPGVTFEAPAGARPTLTFGSIRTGGARRPPVTRFEFVERSVNRYRGTWRTVADSGATASGYFCAVHF